MDAQEINRIKCCLQRLKQEAEANRDEALDEHDNTAYHIYLGKIQGIQAALNFFPQESQ